ncbi:MAG: TonB-dependent receptor plug domain-containing protein, partial [Saprospiraceae bacterium]|nr:TonB-dependent receptor plug domain-containing protein [Saprospiraceae bacterium]
DVASAVRRVTGVTVEGGKYVYVRGLGDRYSKTTLNAAEVPGLDPNRNTVQMDLFPTNLIDNILVYKTFSPNLPGDFTG